MKPYYLLILILLILPSVFALNFSDIDVPIKNKGLSSECRIEYNTFMSQQPEELVQEYCNAVNTRLILLIALIFIMWLLEPLIKNTLIKNKNEWLLIFYKWIGLGLIFFVGYGIYMMK